LRERTSRDVGLFGDVGLATDGKLFAVETEIAVWFNAI